MCILAEWSKYSKLAVPREVGINGIQFVEIMIKKYKQKPIMLPESEKNQQVLITLWWALQFSYINFECVICT